MSEKLEKLAVILEEELALSRRLLDLAKDARAAAISADPMMLVDIVTEQEEKAARLEVIEAERSSFIREVAPELGFAGAGSVRLTDLAERASGDVGAKLRRLGARLKSCVLDLREANAHNRALLEASLDHVDGFFEAVAGARAERGSYGPGHERRVTAAAAVMDRRA